MAGPYVGVGDAELARRAAAGDAGAFERLVGRYRPEIARAALCWLRSRDDVEDVTQETFARALEGIGHLERPEAVGPWLHGIASNICRQTLRQRARLVFCGIAPDPLSDSWHAALDSWHSNCGRSALQGLAALPAQERALLVLHCLEGASLEEVSKLFEVSLGAAKMRLLRARAVARDAAGEQPAERKNVGAALAHAYYYLGLLYLEKSDWERVLRCWKRAIGHAPEAVTHLWEPLRPGAYGSWSLNLIARLSSPESACPQDLMPRQGIRVAMQALEWGLRRYPGNPALWFASGQVLLFGVGLVRAGACAFERAAESPQFRTMALLKEAAGLALAGSAEEAFCCLERLEREMLWDTEVPLVHAIAFAAAGKREAAIYDARRGLSFARAGPQDSFLTAHKFFVPGQILAAFGQEKEAKRAYLSAIEAGPPAPIRTAIEVALARLAS